MAQVPLTQKQFGRVNKALTCDSQETVCMVKEFTLQIMQVTRINMLSNQMSMDALAIKCFCVSFCLEMRANKSQIAH